MGDRLSILSDFGGFLSGGGEESLMRNEVLAYMEYLVWNQSVFLCLLGFL